MDALRLERGGEADLPFVMATERRPGYEKLVGRWEYDRHAAALVDGRHTYFIARQGGKPAGFVILRDWQGPEQVAYIKRAAVAEPGRGLGRRMMELVADAVFEQTGSHRLFLGLFPDNERARRAYEAAGFVAEGISRGRAFFCGEHRDELVMAILRPEWRSRRGVA